MHNKVMKLESESVLDDHQNQWKCTMYMKQLEFDRIKVEELESQVLVPELVGIFFFFLTLTYWM